MDAIPIFYPTNNYLTQYPRRQPNIYLPPLNSHQMPLLQSSQMQSTKPAMSPFDSYYYKNDINMYLNFDGVVPR